MTNGPAAILQKAYAAIKPDILYIAANESDPGTTGAGEVSSARVAVAISAGSGGTGTAVAVDVPVPAGKDVKFFSIWNHQTNTATANFVMGDKVPNNMTYSANGFVRMTLTVGVEWKPTP